MSNDIQSEEDGFLGEEKASFAAENPNLAAAEFIEIAGERQHDPILTYLNEIGRNG